MIFRVESELTRVRIHAKNCKDVYTKTQEDSEIEKKHHVSEEGSKEYLERI
jgi:hypothetical protein